MDFTEIIGFLISLLAFVFLMYRRATRTSNPQEEVEQEQRLKDFLKSLDVEMAEEEEKPARLPPPPKPAKKQAKVAQPAAVQKQESFETYHFDSKMDSYKKHDDYHMIQKAKPSRGRQILLGLKSPKEMIILNEVLNRRYR